MQLQIRKLYTKMTGSTVALLHTLLYKLELTISDDEVKKRCFDRSAEEAIQLLQERHGLPETNGGQSHLISRKPKGSSLIDFDRMGSK